MFYRVKDMEEQYNSDIIAGQEDKGYSRKDIKEDDIISSYEDINNTYKETLDIVNQALSVSKSPIQPSPFVRGISKPARPDPPVISKKITEQDLNMVDIKVKQDSSVDSEIFDSSESIEPEVTDHDVSYREPRDMGTGDLYQLCPCKGNLICYEGICKKPAYDPCVISSECAGDSICYSNVCTPRPGKWVEPINNKCKSGLTISRNHITLLRGKEFKLPPGWMAFEKSIGICEVDESLLILAEEEMYLVNPSNQPSQNNIQLIRETNRPFNPTPNDKLFNYDGDVFFLAGKSLYILEWLEKDQVEWVDFNKYDDDLFVSNEAITVQSIKPEQSTQNQIHLDDGTYVIKHNNTYSIDDTFLRSIVRNSIATHSDTNMSIGMVKDIQMLVRDTNDDTLVIMNKDKTIYRYDYDNGIITKLKGRGEKIVMCDNKIWLFTNNVCISY